MIPPSFVSLAAILFLDPLSLLGGLVWTKNVWRDLSRGYLTIPRRRLVLYVYLPCKEILEWVHSSVLLRYNSHLFDEIVKDHGYIDIVHGRGLVKCAFALHGKIPAFLTRHHSVVLQVHFIAHEHNRGTFRLFNLPYQFHKLFCSFKAHSIVYGVDHNESLSFVQVNRLCLKEQSNDVQHKNLLFVVTCFVIDKIWAADLHPTYKLECVGPSRVFKHWNIQT